MTQMPVSRRLVWLLLYVAVLGLANLPVLVALSNVASRNASASHVVLIPLVTAWLVYLRRHEIFRSVQWERGTGAAVILGGVIVTTLTRSGAASARPDVLTLQVLGLVLAAAGGFLFCFGRTSVRAAAFPLAFLAFTAPIPDLLLDPAVASLKAGSTSMVGVLLGLIGMPYHQVGYVFMLPGVTIEVADACSGIRSSIALVLAMLLTGHLVLDRWWQQAILVAAVLPVAILKNAIRIVALSWLAIYVDPAFLEGRLHTDGGVVFFLLALGLLLPVVRLLRASGGIARTRPSGHATAA
jgi:exosortase